MKTFFLSLLIAGTALTTAAQDGDRIFKRFKGDVSLGYALPLASTANGGILFALEPKFAIVDQLAVGLRMEAAVTAKFTGTDIYGNADVENAKAFASYLATADYYFTNNYSFRPFVGAGAGVFGVADDSNDFVDDAVVVTKFGGLFRVGAEIKHLRFGIEYNLIPRTDINLYTYDNQGNMITTRSTSKNGYIGIKLGVCFGGGPL